MYRVALFYFCTELSTGYFITVLYSPGVIFLSSVSVQPRRVHFPVQYSSILYNTVLTIIYNALLYSSLLHNTVHCIHYCTPFSRMCSGLVNSTEPYLVRCVSGLSGDVIPSQSSRNYPITVYCLKQTSVPTTLYCIIYIFIKIYF